MGTSGSPLLQLRPAVHRVEAAAWRTIESCQRKLGLQEVPLPIPVDSWIEHPLGFRFGIEDLTHLGKGVLGGSFIKERAIVVSDSITNEGRFRFTCAHELGHHVLHRRGVASFYDTAVMTATPSRVIEWQADRFAAAFLMPMPLLLKQLFVIRDELGISRDEMGSLLVSGPESLALWKESFLPAIMARFGVSKAAAIYRFGEIYLADGKPFLLPEHRPNLLPPSPKRPTKANNQSSLFDGR